MSSKSKGINKSISNLIIARGNQMDKMTTELFMNPDIYTKNFTSTVKVLKDSQNFSSNEKSMTVLSNGQSFVKPLNLLLDNAYNMYEAKAYLYQYEKYKLTDAEFKESLATISQIINNYNEL